MAWSGIEKSTLVATLRAADPGAPTLCAGWTVRHLLAHLVLREQAPLQVAGDLLRRPAPGQERNMGHLVNSAQSTDGYEALIQRFWDGPPRWSPFSWLGDAVSLVEYVVHHEDIRRAGPDPAPPRDLPAAEQDAIWQRVKIMAGMGYRRSPVGVELALPDGRGRRAHSGSGAILITGEPAELALHALGRRSVAKVKVTGGPEALQRFETWAAG